MGYRFVDWAWEQDTKTPTEKLVLLALARKCGDKGTCWPSIRLLADQTGTAERTVKRALKALKDRGVIAVRERFNDRRQTSSLYVLGGDTKTPTGVTYCHPRGCQDVTQTTNRNYKEEPLKIAVGPDGPTAVDSWRFDMNTSEQVLRNLKQKNSDVDKPVTAGTLCQIWGAEVPKYSSLKFIREPTRKELGQFAQFIRKVGKDRAISVIRHSVVNWHEFVDFTKRSAGVSSAPGAPHVGFLLRYCNEAVSYLEASQKPLEAYTPPQPKAALPSKPKKAQAAPQKPTLEELHQIVWGS